MTSTAAALSDLIAVLDEKIDHCTYGTGEDHPWIPGANFKDGRIYAAIERGRQALK